MGRRARIGDAAGDETELARPRALTAVGEAHGERAAGAPGRHRVGAGQRRVSLGDEPRAAPVGDVRPGPLDHAPAPGCGTRSGRRCGRRSRAATRGSRRSAAARCRPPPGRGRSPPAGPCPSSGTARRGRPARSRRMVAGRVLAHLDRGRADAGERVAFLLDEGARHRATKTSGCPGIVQSGSTMARPRGPAATPSVLSSGLATFRPPRSRSGSGWSARGRRRRPARSRSRASRCGPRRRARRSSRLAFRSATRRIGGEHRGAAFQQHDRGFARVDVAEVPAEGVASGSRPRAPAISTPVGPAADDDERIQACRRTGSGSRSARSKAESTRRRISRASSRLLSPGASGSQSSWPK